MRRYKGIICIALAASLLSAGSTMAEPSRTASGDVRKAYDAARRCYVANGHVYSAVKKAGDVANTQLFEKRVKTAFDQAYFYGGMLRLNRQQITRDLDATTNAELPKLIRDSSYLTIVARDCKTWGLM